MYLDNVIEKRNNIIYIYNNRLKKQRSYQDFTFKNNTQLSD